MDELNFETLAPGEYYVPGGPDYSNQYLQTVFIERVDSLIGRKVSDCLAAEWSQMRRNCSDHDISDLVARCAHRFHLAHWMLIEGIFNYGWARGRLHKWAAKQDPHRRGMPLLQSEKFYFAHDGVDLSFHTLAELDKDIRKAIDEQVRQYLDGVRRMAAAKGWKKVVHKRGRHGQDVARHFSWLARFQCCGETYKSIAATERASLKAVIDGIHSIAELLKLQLRTEGIRGRPKKSR